MPKEYKSPPLVAIVGYFNNNWIPLPCMGTGTITRVQLQGSVELQPLAVYVYAPAYKISLQLRLYWTFANTSVTITTMSSFISDALRWRLLMPQGWDFVGGLHPWQCLYTHRRSTWFQSLNTGGSIISISTFRTNLWSYVFSWCVLPDLSIVSMYFLQSEQVAERLRAAARPQPPKSRQSCCRLLWRGQGEC